jgi:hypothetical protein
MDNFICFDMIFFTYETYTFGYELKTLWIQKINQLAKNIVFFLQPKD